MEEVCFIDPCWLAKNVLNPSNALEYFSSSPFYDRTCNNEVLKMQSKFRKVTQDQLHNMAPRIQRIYCSRLTNALFYLYNALDLYLERRTFDVRDGFKRKSHADDSCYGNDSDLQNALKIMNEQA
ncbi:UNVERIFIED_CONTAM: hypothetical protein PYX00_011825 [Menopon gallinae]|uniref:Mediator of RNA polymerase II transcription subunit 6 n=1 Tax=Menopon gallinae TaxID=328185 RepID=A0AAW2H8D9_9NEOP